MSSDAAVHRFAALCAEASDKRGGAKVQPMRIHRSDDEIRTDAAVLEKRIAADLAPVVRALDLQQQFGDFAFGDSAADGVGKQRLTPFQRSDGRRVGKEWARTVRNR